MTLDDLYQKPIQYDATELSKITPTVFDSSSFDNFTAVRDARKKRADAADKKSKTSSTSTPANTSTTPTPTTSNTTSNFTALEQKNPDYIQGLTSGAPQLVYNPTTGKLEYI